jgi:hypothetical protein
MYVTSREVTICRTCTIPYLWASCFVCVLHIMPYLVVFYNMYCCVLYYCMSVSFLLRRFLLHSNSYPCVHGAYSTVRSLSVRVCAYLVSRNTDRYVRLDVLTGNRRSGVMLLTWSIQSIATWHDTALSDDTMVAVRYHRESTTGRQAGRQSSRSYSNARILVCLLDVLEQQGTIAFCCEYRVVCKHPDAHACAERGYVLGMFQLSSRRPSLLRYW